MQHARGYYRKDGRETPEGYIIRVVLRHLARLCGKRPAVDFTPKRLQAVGERLIEAG